MTDIYISIILFIIAITLLCIGLMARKRINITFINALFPIVMAILLGYNTHRYANDPTVDILSILFPATLLAVSLFSIYKPRHNKE